MKKTLALLVVLILAGTTASLAGTIALTVDGGWYFFSFGDVNSPWSDDFTFTLTGPGVLKVTDAYLDGDQFEVFNFASSIGLTSTPTNSGASTTNYDYAFADPRWSSRAWNLGSGSYDISGIAVLSPHGGGGAALEVVPLPGAAWLLVSGLLGLAGLRWRRS